MYVQLIRRETGLLKISKPGDGIYKGKTEMLCECEMCWGSGYLTIEGKINDTWEILHEQPELDMNFR